MSLSWARNSVLVNSTSTMPVQLTKLVMSAAVTVRPIVLNCRPIGRSSKNRPSPTVSITTLPQSPTCEPHPSAADTAGSLPRLRGRVGVGAAAARFYATTVAHSLLSVRRDSGVVRIALIHAVTVAMAPVHEAFARLWPAAECIDILDTSLSLDRERDGQLTAGMTRRIGALADYAVSTGADGILFTCSAFGE